MARKGHVRIDELLVARGLAPHRDKARALVMAGQVLASEQRVKNPSETFPVDVALRITGQERFVSRGGDKLLGALEDLGLVDRVRGAHALDVGASTGGFTDCLLQLGATAVLAVDSGTNQLAWSLRTDSRVRVFENTDIKTFMAPELGNVDWVVADVSFQSLARVLEILVPRLAPEGVTYVLLVKPQFELPRDMIPPGGVVADEAARAEAVTMVRAALHRLGLQTIKVVPSRVIGRTGNQEFFLHAQGPRGPATSS